ncbi:cytochrome P450 family protein [Amycolatopsis nigrescens]|uniref:cytochrome P450 family protein n=1 Tax=Amycolatopsis nigrescens TaxID=381445 RepID=UPI00037C3D25|nr:cytochrome P450 [Amycolatopsis nigrescens]
MSEAPFSFPANPHTYLDQLGETGPPRQITLNGKEVWLLSRHADVRACLADPRLSLPTVYAINSGQEPPLAGLFRNTMLGSEPPEHTRLRRLISNAFTVRRVEALRPRVQAITDDLLDRIAPLGHAELVHDLALPLPVLVTAELLGIPEADRLDFRLWSDTMLWPGDGPDPAGRAREAGENLWRYIEKLTEDKREAPGDDLISALVSAGDEDRLSYQEVVATGRFMLVSGYETTANLLGNAILALLLHPDQLALLRREPGLIKQATEELLRYAGPGIINVRIAEREVRLGTAVIRPGQQVVMDLAAANQDPAHFRDGSILDITRTPNPHLQFGHGIHHCLGAPLARVEAQVAIGSVLRRFPDLGLAVDPGEIGYRQHVFLHSLVELPVRFGAAAATLEAAIG